jgi:hypothetical protein
MRAIISISPLVMSPSRRRPESMPVIDVASRPVEGIRPISSDRISVPMRWSAGFFCCRCAKPSAAFHVTALLPTPGSPATIISSVGARPFVKLSMNGSPKYAAISMPDSRASRSRFRYFR